jgi:hypothetical protein
MKNRILAVTFLTFVDDAMAAGLSQASLDQLDSQVSEIIYDLYDSTLQGR